MVEGVWALSFLGYVSGGGEEIGGEVERGMGVEVSYLAVHTYIYLDTHAVSLTSPHQRVRQCTFSNHTLHIYIHTATSHSRLPIHFHT